MDQEGLGKVMQIVAKISNRKVGLVHHFKHLLKETNLMSSFFFFDDFKEDTGSHRDRKIPKFFRKFISIFKTREQGGKVAFLIRGHGGQ